MLVAKQEQRLSRRSPDRTSGTGHREASARPLRRQARGRCAGDRATGVDAERTGDQARPEIQTAYHSAMAAEAIERIAALYPIESEVRGKPPNQRRELRQSRSRPPDRLASLSIATTSI